MDIDFYRKWACQKMIESSHSNIWEGHWACAVLALIQLMDENLVPGSLEVTIRKNLERILEEHVNEQHYRADKEFAGFRAGMINLIIQNSHNCHALGHDVIYAYYILNMLSRSDVMATAELFEAMAKILREFAASGPGFVTVNGNNVVVYPDSIPHTSLRFDLTPNTVLNLFHDFQRPLQMEKGDMQLGHLLTHGHSIAELKTAYRELAFDKLDSAFFTRVDIITYANKLEDPVAYNLSLSETMWNPLEPSYWEQAFADSRHGHFYKYAYSYLKLHRMAGRSPSDYRSFSRIL
ncbi:hypothetical protein AB6A23_24145 [Paenibacillus tarimensis]